MNLQILSTSDSHTFWWGEETIAKDVAAPYGLFRAASVLSTMTKDAEKNGDFLIKIDNGDFIQGPLLGNYIAESAPDQATIFSELPKQIAYDVRTLGNHEFNFGIDYLKKIFEDDQTLLNANVLDKKTGQPFIGQAYKIFEKKGKKVAVIGLTTKYVPNWEKPENIRGIEFVDPVQVAKGLIKQLKSRVDAIVIAYHGGFARDLTTGAILEPETGENQGNELLKLSGLSALVTGHQHRQIAGVYNGVPVSQPGYRAEAVGQLTIPFTDEKNQKGQTQPAVANLVHTNNWPEDAKLLAQYQSLKEKLDAWLDQVLANSGIDLTIQSVPRARQTGHPFVDLINHIQLEATGADLSATALFNDEVAGFGHTITRRSILGNYPFPNTLVTIAMTGKQVQKALETNAAYFTLVDQQIAVNPAYHLSKKQDYNYDLWLGLDYRFDLTKPIGQRVTIEAIQQQPFDPYKTYRVVVNNYRATGAGNQVFKEGKVLSEGRQTISELIENYFQNHDNIFSTKQKHFHIDY
ncbi:bifunctional metallophosphatase/5'-nucleotidase [Fructobacillus fructosus]|uniref:bifunctional metallophosphatase/5'-nucleotidase n=1 Tax=Fructobacillus fructosus TaxID=1631 RepID=UPI001658A2F9|nr:bifunctional UDP-sugar hydrolase/5'-nucleotidase [Fructobacillus fructosus]MBC9118798.1 bifunctional metallophosphatase/5'-nucleotidase [Fructobacillus fructosus]MBD9365462.1 bifunctional metallophosphatase/5'-nucleotidase [Leuconostoc mesenteroides]CAK1236800.1 2' [Fructobacillus fructosus]